MIIGIFEIMQKKTKNLWVKVKTNIFPKSTPRPFFESLEPSIPVYPLISFDISPPCADNTPT